ncbi:hypothetical protein J2S43_006899 [Catenuloplanes nepalensis]|uniref:Lipoprotein n=1 Tax=Catenuloplanes nepalensis TaxID=587533 RepID=A0ABT9N3V3_9ACTN|nr:hypothetical protein [Catenuloplanes nepalensis]MDP9798387.1 hypothetical protein [Catenuloplanes nepalensis]
MTTVARLAGTFAVLAVALAGCATDNSTTVPPPTTDQATETARVLAAATAVQGMCYGWDLRADSSSDGAPVSRGSSLGAQVPVDSDPTRCAEYIEVVARVTYTSASSEAEDSATMTVETNSPRVTGADLAARLRTMGFTTSAFIDDPGFMVMHAALSLPLVTAEAGAATPVPATGSSAASDASLAALPPAGNDFLRDRWGFLVFAGAFVLAGLGAIGLGLWQRGRVKEPKAWSTPKPGATPKPGPAKS